MQGMPRAHRKIARDTKETRILVEVNLDEPGETAIATGVGFFDHMLTHIAHHGRIGLRAEAEGDLHIDAHHTVEDVGIALGQALSRALGDAHGIRRYGQATVPMDEALAEAVLDISGRPFLVFDAHIPKVTLGDFDAELAEEFFRALAVNARMTLHLRLHYGQNVHHCLEGLFKAFARALATAVAHDPTVRGAPSTKGVIERGV